MKYLLMIFLVLVTGCAQLQNGQIQPVVVKDYKNKIMFTTCSGAVEDWASCYKKAKMACENGYKMIEQKEDANGGIRTFTFQCK